MRKYLFILAWFFTAHMPDSLVPGAQIIMTMGPFQSKAICEERKDIAQAVFDSLGTIAEWSGCEEAI